MNANRLLVGLGVAIGIPLALAAARITASRLSGFLFGLSTTDARTISFAILLMIASAAVAGFLPARRAARIDPMDALRCE